MKNRILIIGIMTFCILSCKNDVPVSPAAPAVPVEKPKKNDIPNPPAAPENPTSGNRISVK